MLVFICKSIQCICLSYHSDDTDDYNDGYIIYNTGWNEGIILKINKDIVKEIEQYRNGDKY
jgi:hypothetical protein